jgi:hypothetical protein
MNSVVAFAIALYSAYVEDLEMVGCFLKLLDKIFEPRKTQYLDVDLWSSGHPIKPASK